MNALLLALWLSTAGQTEPAPEPEEEAEPTPTSAARFRGAIEIAVLTLPSGPRGGGQDLFVTGLPLLAFDAGPDFGVELGAALRLRVFDDPPEQRAFDHGGILRREDWDQLSDFGQVLRELRIGAPAAPFHFRAGAFTAYTLGNGQLISRYTNQLNPDYHPAGAVAVAFIGATRTELFASDVLGGRLFAGELTVDLGRAVGAGEAAFDRYHGSLAVAHDFGRAGGSAPSLSLAWLELDAALVRDDRFQLTGYLGTGGRVQDDGASIGATLGVAADGQPRWARLGGRLEVRKQNSGFRQGMIGFDYEVARFSGIGLGLAPLAEERLPNGFSFYGEFALALGASDPNALGEPAFLASVSAEHFTWGRTQLDLSVRARAFGGKGALGARASVVGLGQAPRYLTGIEARYRFLPSLYLLGSGGTVFFPQADGGLSRGAWGALGVGADFAR